MARVIDRLQGHEHIWQKLLEQKALGRLPHASVFSGPPGIGKKQMAMALAQALVCERDPAPCGECGPCKRVAIGQSESVLILEPTSGSIKLEAASSVLEFLSLQRIGRARVVIVDQANLLNAQTGNAMLKAVEEPPPETFFIFIASEVSQLLPTLRSRVQNVRFAPLPDSVLKQSEDVPDWMLRSARGSFEILEQFKSPEMADLRALAIDFLKDAQSDQRGSLDKAQAESKDREMALQFARLMQQLLRDWSVLGQEHPIHSDLAPTLSALSNVEPRVRVGLWRQAFQLETDIVAHIDRGLCLENFYYRARQALR